MIERIGKYRILGQVGRGGMGTVYRAHDPILDRTVALKVISGEAGLTDELRARFFREAQACAKLSHQNIITVHDLGEEDGHLFIVMEYLEGEELKQLIGQRRPLPLPTKVDLMVQVCAGLDYAHQKGVIHRDIKPGNIFVLKNGAVKILDFGIARLVSANTGLTRTGLIMGTLRYMSPEQARGRVDQRSDIFSAGAVFYELLTFRPPFAGEDPMEILEQLRSEDPVAPALIDPSVPSELSTVIERALRKDPAARFASFGEMRAALEPIRRQLEEQSGALRRRLREQREDVARLWRALAERTGISPPTAAATPAEDPVSFTAIEIMHRELAAESARLAEMVRRADVIEPQLRSAVAKLEAGDAEDAAADLARLVQAMPEHSRASEALARARQRSEEERQQVARLRSLLAESEAAFERGAYAECLERLNALAGARLPGLAERIEGLSEAAAAALAAEEAARREALRQAAERAQRAHATARELRRDAEEQGARTLAAPLWSVAEAKLAEAEAALGQQAFGPAGKRLDEAQDLYRRAAEGARRESARRARERAERARAEVDEARRLAMEAEAESLVRPLWMAAEAAAAEVERASDAPETAVTRAGEAVALYRQAVVAAQEERRRLARERAERERAVCDHARGQAHGAELLAPDAWAAAESLRVDAAAALDAERWEAAAETFARAAELYGRSREAAAREAMRRARERALRARSGAQDARAQAQEARAEALAAPAWTAAEGRLGEAEGSWQAERWDEAGRGFGEAAGLFERARELAREERRRRAEEQAARARAAGEDARRRAEAAEGRELAAEAWHAAERQWAMAEQSLQRRALEESATQFDQATDLFRQAEARAREAAARRARLRAEQAHEAAIAARNEAMTDSAPDLAPEPWREAEAQLAAGRSALDRGDSEGSAPTLSQARAIYQRAREMAVAVALERARDQALAGRERAATARRVAEAVDAAVLGGEPWAAAEGKLAAGEAALARQRFPRATRQFEEAVDLYERAVETARREALQAARERAERARDRAAGEREEAQARGAEILASPAWAEAEERRAAALAALDREEYDAAAAALEAAADGFETAAEAATREAKRRAREDLARRHREAREARARAFRAEAPALAGPIWSAAEQRVAEARRAEEDEAIDRSAVCLDEALELYGQAETRAREAAVRRERARAAEDRTREARAEAEQRSAARRAATAWAAALAEEDRARQAAERGEFDEAKAAFTDAGRGFQAASAAAETWLPTQLAAARELVAADDPGRALEVLENLLAEDPDHTEGRQLLEEVRRALTPPPQPISTFEEPTLVGVGHGSSAAAGPGDDETVLALPETARADATVFAPPVLDATLPGSDVARRPDDAAVRPERAVPLHRKGGPGRRAWIGVGVSLAAALAVGLIGWHFVNGRVPRQPSQEVSTPPVATPQAPPIPAPRPRTPPAPAPPAPAPGVEDTGMAALRDQTAAARGRAEQVQAGRLAPETFGRASELERGAALSAREGNPAKAAQQYRDASTAYIAAATEAGRAMEREGEARRAQDRAAGARRAAREADAAGRARAKWDEAGQLERSATQAMGDRAFDQARDGFDRAARTFQEAAVLARQSADAERQAQREAEVSRARTLAVEARKSAQAADAPRRAAAKWALAEGLTRDAEQAARDKDAEAARERFAGAEGAYRDALALARQSADDEAQKRDAERREREARRVQVAAARDAMAAARRAAEQASAERYASRTLASGRARQKDGEDAFQKQDYDRAGQLFRAAQADYEQAAREAGPREVEDLRGQASSEQDQARRAEAPELAKPQFERARARQADADTLLARQDLPGAKQAYTDAAQGFGEATRVARANREDRDRANVARSRMAAQKSQAASDAKDYAAAAAQERQGDAQYQRLAFRDAAESYRVAADGYARAVGPGTQAHSAADEIRALLSTYARALQTGDGALLRRVQPGLSEADVRKNLDAFDRVTSVKAVDESIEISGSVALVRGRLDVVADKENRPSQTQSRFSFVLVRTTAGWHIERATK